MRPITRTLERSGLVSLLIWLAVSALAVPPPVLGQESSPVPAPAISHRGGGWQVVDQRPIEVDGQPVALSPDGQWIAGIGNAGAFCVWEVETLEPACNSQAPHAEADSIAWAPDSSAVAFSHADAIHLFADSDILVFEIAEGELRNLTDAEQGVGGQDAEDPMVADVFPAWSPDGSELAFARLGLGERAVIMRVDREGGDAKRITSAGAAVASHLHWVEGDRIIYAAFFSGTTAGIWEVGLDGSPARNILPGGSSDEVPEPVLADASPDGGFLSVYSARQLAQARTDDLFAVVNVQTGDVQTFDVLLEGGVPEGIGLPPRFSPDGRWLITTAVDDAGTGAALGVWQPGSDGPTIRLPLAQEQVPDLLDTLTGLSWAENDTVLLPTGDGTAWLLILNPDNPA